MNHILIVVKRQSFNVLGPERSGDASVHLVPVAMADVGGGFLLIGKLGRVRSRMEVLRASMRLEPSYKKAQQLGD